MKRARRCAIFLWLPAILAALIVLAGSSLKNEYQVTSWYYDPADPKRIPWKGHTFHATEENRLFAFNLDLHLDLGFLFKPPPNFVEAVERTDEHWRLARPHLEITGIVAAGAFLLLLSGYLPARWFIAIMGKRAARRHVYPELAVSLRTCTGLLTAPTAAGTWLLLPMTVLLGMPVLPHVLDTTPVLAWGILIALIMFILPLMLGFVRLVRADSARVFFPSRVTVLLTVCLLSIGGPLLATRLLFRLLS